jgi:hypothetical protein
MKEATFECVGNRHVLSLEHNGEWRRRIGTNGGENRPSSSNTKKNNGDKNRVTKQWADFPPLKNNRRKKNGRSTEKEEKEGKRKRCL